MSSREWISDLENTVFGRLAKSHFRLVSPPRFSKSEPRQPLLRKTPEEEKETIVKIWRVVLRFTGDSTDYKPNSDTSSLPYLGSVISRLSMQWGLSTNCIQNYDVQDDKRRSTEFGLSLKILPNKPKGGTVGRLREALSQHLFKNKNDPEHQTVPVEDTLYTALDQVHYIASCGILKPILRDEIYCMLCKQTVGNPNKTGADRYWTLLGLITGCFPPSHEIQGAMMEFVQEAPPFYSNALKKALVNSARNGARHQPPSYRELECYRQKKPIELQITLMDGTVQTIVADGTSMAREICDRLNRALGLRKAFGYSLYIALANKVASLSSAYDHVMDAISQCEQLHRAQGGQSAAPWRLFYRKELFAPWEDTAGDIIAVSLTFAQVARGIMIGEYTCDSDQDLAVLAARQYFTEYGSEISEDGLQSVLPSYIPADRRTDPEWMKTWRRLVIRAHRRLFSGQETEGDPAIDDVKLDVINYAKQNWAMSFSRYYDVIKLEGPQWDDCQLKLAVNSTGVYVLASDKRVLLEMTFPSIITIRGEGSVQDESTLGLSTDDVVLFVLADGSFIKFESVDAFDVRSLVHDLISGLRMRSVWAVVRADTSDVIRAEEGDLVKLERPAGNELSSSEYCLATNVQTNERGNIATNILYVLPVLHRPSTEVLRMFQPSPRRRGSFHNYLEEGSLQNLPNVFGEYTGRLSATYRRATDEDEDEAGGRPVVRTAAFSLEREDYANGNVHPALGNLSLKEGTRQRARVGETPAISNGLRDALDPVTVNSVDCISAL